MLKGIQELAGNKLLLLYIVNKISNPISNNQLTDVVLENNLLNYFSLQQYISELVSAGFLSMSKDENRQLYSISPKGRNALEYFEDRIDASKKKIIDAYLSGLKDVVSQPFKATAEYYPGDENYIVTCKFEENGKTLIEIKLNTPSIDKAKLICTNWKNDAEKKYKNISNLLNN